MQLYSRIIFITIFVTYIIFFYLLIHWYVTLPPPRGPRGTICTPEVGRLGNNLFQFASTFGIAVHNDMLHVIPKTSVVNKWFDLSENRWLSIVDDDCSGGEKILESHSCIFEERLYTLPSKEKDVVLGHYLQSWKYFRNNIIQVKQQLKFKQSIRNEANVILQNVKRKHNNTVVVGIHIRRGDKANDAHTIEYGNEVPSPINIYGAMKYFDDNTTFVVTSDDMNWSRANVNNEKFKVEFVRGSNEAVDMAVLSSCDHLITTVGTYGWWAGFLLTINNGGNVFYYKWPAREGLDFRKQFDKGYVDHFLPVWKGY